MANEYDHIIKELEAKDKMSHSSAQEDFVREEQAFITPEQDPRPLSAIRSSEPDLGNTGFAGKSAVLLPDYPVEWMNMLEHLSVFNRHVSYAVDNIVTMAHTKSEIYFSDSVPQKKQQEMRDYLASRSDNYYEYSGGETTLVNDLFTQLAIYGCVSIEKIPTEKLDGIKKVVRVSPKWVRFIYDDKIDKSIPVQQPRYTVGRNSSINGYIALNPKTYSYHAMRRINESPYATPPFIAAIEDLITQYDMMGNFKQMMKKLGMLGFLSVMVKAPTKKTGEDEQDYYNRLSNYLETKVTPQVKKQMATGVAIGFKDTHEFKLEGSNMNAQAAEGLMKMIKTMIFSGLHQDPNMHGENFSYSEAFGRVILQKMGMQIRNYQQLVAKIREEIYMMDLVLAGYKPGYVKVEYEAPAVSDVYKDAQAEQLKIQNVNAKVDRGYISHQAGAIELGYDEPYSKEPLAPVVPAQSTPAKAPAMSQNSFSLDLKRLGAEHAEYNYDLPEGCSFDAKTGDKYFDGNVQAYNAGLESLYTKAITYTVDKSRSSILQRKGSISAQQLSDILFYNLYSQWDLQFKSKAKDLTNKYVQNTYQHYRTDKKIFSKSKKGSSQNSFFDVPDSIFTLKDFNTIDYLKASDDFYLGKFITDEDTRRRIVDFVNEYYLDHAGELGNKSVVDAFLKEFSDLAHLEAFKIRRITETTINKARSFSSIRYIEQAQVSRFEIIEIGDRLTCDYCAHMNGKTFEVESAIKLIDDVVNSPVENVPNITPFATTLKIEDFKRLSSTELLSKGIALPPYHCHCRGSVIADI